ncbi:MAG: PQQ-binding-like beta-propeller repeat protein [Bdellovibrionales bacterium]|nr:PQQ-binding-like beta-propeller repeat protein [Bdellovibrionales bacterium]
MNQHVQVPKELSFKTEWIVSTLQSPYLGYRRLHAMKPVFWRDNVIVGNTIDGIVCLDKVSGAKIWTRKFKGGVGIAAEVSENKIFVGTGEGQFMALSASNGETVWSYPIHSLGVGAPLVSRGKVYFISGDHILYALDAQTGRKLWTYNRQVSTTTSIFGAGRPLEVDNKIFAGFADGHFVALEKNTGGLIWDVALKTEGRFRDVDSSPVHFDNKIYVASFDGSLFSIDKEGNVLWRSEGGAASDLLVTDNRIYYSTTDGRVVALDRLSGKLIWEKKNLRGYGTGPIFYKNMLLVGETSGRLLALNLEQGETVSEFSPGHGVSSSVAISEDHSLYFGSLGANLFSIQLAWKETNKKWPWD